MKLIFEDLEFEYTYNIEIECIVYNKDNLDDSILSVVAENFSDKVIQQIQDNSKFIRSSLDIQDFDVVFYSAELPSIILQFSTNKLIDTDAISSVVGRYTSASYAEQFTEDDGDVVEVQLKPVRGELKVYLSNEL